MFSISAASIIPPAPLDLAEHIIANHGPDLGPEAIDAAITAEGWAPRGEWGRRVVERYRSLAFEAKTGMPF